MVEFVGLELSPIYRLLEPEFLHDDNTRWINVEISSIIQYYIYARPICFLANPNPVIMALNSPFPMPVYLCSVCCLEEEPSVCYLSSGDVGGGLGWVSRR